MKAILTSIFSIFLLTGMDLSAQNYSLILHESDQYVFRHQDQLIIPKLDRISEFDNHAILFWEQESSFEIDESFETEFCVSNTAATALGFNIFIDDYTGYKGDHFIRYDREFLEEAQIKVSASPGDSWIAILSFMDTGEAVMATCTKIEYTDIGNGVMDSVKTIQFSNDLCDLIISKNHGIVQTPNWNFNQWRAPQPCIERVWEEDEILQQTKIPFGDQASDLQEGVELHILDIKGHELLGNVTTKEIRAFFMFKTFDEVKGEYSLTFAEEVKEIKWVEGVTTERTYRDTTTTVFSRWPGIDVAADESVPINQFFWEDDGEWASIVNYGQYNNRLTYSHLPAAYNGSVSEYPEGCFPLTFDLEGPYSYYDGLAGPYYDTGNFYPVYRMLNYYKKGNEEFGDPFDFLLSADEQLIASGIEMYPNPVGNHKELIVTNLPQGVHIVQITDLTGKTLFTANMDAYVGDTQRVQLPELHSGIYLISFQTKSGGVYFRKLMK